MRDFNRLPAARPDEAPRWAGIIVSVCRDHSTHPIQQFVVIVGRGCGLNYANTLNFYNTWKIAFSKKE
jgi:hypothetical protein